MRIVESSKGKNLLSMKKSLIVTGLLVFVGLLVEAQIKYEAPHNARYSPEMSLRELYDTTFLQKMSKEDWVRFSNDPRFDADRVAKIKTEWKRNHASKQGQRKTLQSSSEAYCRWIEPTSDYEHPNTIQWPGSPGNSTDNYSDPINLGWNFNFFGQNFNQVVLTTKGTIVLGNTGYIDFTPSAFPDPITGESTQQYNHICGYWTDFDFAASGDLYYYLTPEALYVNYIDVGYWPNNADKVNSFQMIITPDGSSVLSNGNNVEFCYYDMQFANSQISGATGGCQATTNIANVGCDRSSGAQHYAFGRFNLCNSTAWNGPYGATAAQQDGVDWLDGRCIAFNTSITNFNLNQPPVPIGEACDTITMCIGESFNFDLAFVSPESNQTTSIAYTQSSTGFTATTVNSSSTQTNSAVLQNATFIASAANVGMNTVTITATDNGSPAASTSVTYYFDVDGAEAPPISISGVSNICAGAATLLTATDGFDSYEWSNGSQTQSSEVTAQGPISVIGHFGNCSSVASLVVDVTPYFIPQLEGGNVPVELCPGQTASLCVLGDYESYEWFIYPGFDGEFVTGTPLDQPCVEVTGNVNGNYGIHVVDSTGCVGENIKLVTITESFVSESNVLNNGPHCDGLLPISFEGYSNPADDNLVIYGLSTSAQGWSPAYVNIYIYPAGGGAPEEYFFTTFASLTVKSDIIIGAGDSIVIEYFSNTSNFQGNSLWVINCGQTSPTIIAAPLEDGVVFNALSTCVSVPLEGQWTITGPGNWDMTNMDLMTSTFTPAQYGEYELCFEDPACNVNHCYDVEYNLPPSLEISPNLNVLLCDDETTNYSLDITDVGNTGVINWTGAGVTPSGDLLSAAVGPYTGYVSNAITASVTNGCGTASASVNVAHQPDVPEPVLTDQHLCANGSVLFDPIPSAQDNPLLQYNWTGNDSGPTLTVTQTGTYTVQVSNDCDQSGIATAVVEGVVAATVTSQPPANILECNNGSVPLQVNYSNAGDYVVSWQGPVTGNTNSISANEDGNYCWTVTDVYNCNLNVTGCTSVNISSEPTTTAGNGSIMALCPNECEPLDMVANGENLSFSWNTSCQGYPINSSSASVDYCANNVPELCLGLPITITATASNSCGEAQATWSVQTNACELNIPNIFTPNGDSKNDTFEIRGLENYNNAELTIFNRWGEPIYESTNYKNNWNAADIADGTYWYLLKLPYGSKTDYKGFLTIVKD
jgi:gliding motility-associated-like protein